MNEWTPIRTMEPKILERLEKVFPKKRFQTERVAPVMTLEEFKRITRQAPYIGLAFLGMKNDPKSGRYTDGKWQWRLIVVAKAVGGFDRQVKGDAFDIGLDAIMDVAVCVLNGFTFDEIGDAHVTQSEVVYSEEWGNKAIVLAHIDFEVSTMMMSGSLELETLEDFHGINAFWLIPDDNKGEENGSND